MLARLPLCVCASGVTDPSCNQQPVDYLGQKCYVGFETTDRLQQRLSVLILIRIRASGGKPGLPDTKGHLRVALKFLFYLENVI